ncbi:MAG: tetratricopeptide repeat protein [Verrucomicrobiota bacterium]
MTIRHRSRLLVTTLATVAVLGSDARAQEEASKLSNAKLIERAETRSSTRDYRGALADYNEHIKRNPKDSEALHERGVVRFMLGDFEGSVSDFDAYLKKHSRRAPHHWQRGLSLYCAGRYAEGRKQFEDHQKVNSNDVENAVWHYICVAREKNLAEAKKKLIPIKGDTRVPMAEIHRLFAGKGTKEDVLAAADKDATGEALRSQRCYAHLYLALYEEAAGNEKVAATHYAKAGKEFFVPHYMGETARVLYEARSNPRIGSPLQKKTTTQP